MKSIIENEKGEASDIDKVYLHHCGDKSIYESTSLAKNKDSDIKNSYTATFNIPIDRNDKKDTKLIVYSSDLSKIYDTKGIHAYTGTAIISIGYKDKSGASFSYTNKVSLRDITDHIVNVVSDSQYPFKTNEEISLKAIYKQEKGSKRYKEVLWGYKVIKTIEYNEVSKSNPKDVVALKDQKGKEIRFKISDLIKKDDLDKIKQGGHTIVFFAYLEGEKDKFKYKSVYGKNHIRIDIMIPLYIKFKDDKLIIYEFEHAIKEKSFKASLNHDDALVNKSGYLYINKDMSAQDINIYEDDKLTKELKSYEKTNKRYQIYVQEENKGQANLNKDDKYGINLLSKDNMNSFINSFNESKSITRVDKGMWVDGDKGVGVDLKTDNKIAWGKKVSLEFKEKVIEICINLKINPDFLMSCMAFETGETFSASIKNPVASAIGLIQFLETTAASLGTTTSKLANMSEVEQLEYVEKYFMPYAGKIETIEDIYMAIIYPKAVGKSNDYVLFSSSSSSYIANKGLDKNMDGSITKDEAAAKVKEKLEKGLKKGYKG